MTILQPDFTVTPDTPPTPPPGAVRWQVQRERELQNADMHAEAREIYGKRLPMVIPFYYTMDDIVDRVHGFNRQPQFVGKVGQRIPATRKRVAGEAIGAAA